MVRIHVCEIEILCSPSRTLRDFGVSVQCQFSVRGGVCECGGKSMGATDSLCCHILPNVVVRLTDRSLLFRLVSCRLVCLLFVALFGVEMCTTYLVFCEGVLVNLRTRFSDGYLLV